MGWIAVDDPEIDSVSQYPADQSERSGRCAGTTAHVRPAAQLVGLDEGPCLARHDVAHDFCEDRLGQILDPTRSKQGNNVPLDTSEVDIDSRLLLGSAAFAEDETVSEIVHVALAELLHRHGLIEFGPFFRRIIALRDPTKLGLCLAPCSLRRPYAVQADRVADRKSTRLNSSH